MVEQGATDEVIFSTQHEDTRRLLADVPKLHEPPSLSEVLESPARHDTILTNKSQFTGREPLECPLTTFAGCGENVFGVESPGWGTHPPPMELPT